MKNMITEIQQRLDIMDMSMEEAEVQIQISDIEAKLQKVMKLKKRERIMEHEIRRRDISDFITCNNIHIISLRRRTEKRGQKIHLRKTQLKTALI